MFFVLFKKEKEGLYVLIVTVIIMEALFLTELGIKQL